MLKPRVVVPVPVVFRRHRRFLEDPIVSSQTRKVLGYCGAVLVRLPKEGPILCPLSLCTTLPSSSCRNVSSRYVLFHKQRRIIDGNCRWFGSWECLRAPPWCGHDSVILNILFLLWWCRSFLCLFPISCFLYVFVGLGWVGFISFGFLCVDGYCP